jgi:hypothetical protein
MPDRTGHFLDGLHFLLDEEVAAGITADPATTPVAISLAPNTPALPRAIPSPPGPLWSLPVCAPLR